MQWYWQCNEDTSNRWYISLSQTHYSVRCENIVAKRWSRLLIRRTLRLSGMSTQARNDFSMLSYM